MFDDLKRIYGRKTNFTMFFTPTSLVAQAKAGRVTYVSQSTSKVAELVSVKTVAKLEAFLEAGEEMPRDDGSTFKMYKRGKLALALPDGWSFERIDKEEAIRARVIALGIALPEWTTKRDDNDDSDD